MGDERRNDERRSLYAEGPPEAWQIVSPGQRPGVGNAYNSRPEGVAEYSMVSCCPAGAFPRQECPGASPARRVLVLRSASDGHHRCEPDKGPEEVNSALPLFAFVLAVQAVGDEVVTSVRLCDSYECGEVVPQSKVRIERASYDDHFALGS
jgi:hypothetical protein